MKIEHYKNLFGEFKKRIVDSEIAELKTDGKIQEIADRITNEWTMLPEEARGNLDETAAKAYAAAGIDINAVEVVRLALNKGLIYAKIAADCQGSEDELARLWAFLKLDDPGTGLDTDQNPSTPFGIAQSEIEKGSRASAPAMPGDIRDRVLAAMRNGGGKSLLEKRWKDKGVEPRFPQKYAKTSRAAFAPSVKKPEELAMLKHSFDLESPLPQEFALLSMLDPANSAATLQFFEPTCDYQALLLFLIDHTEEFPAWVFFSYYFYCVYFDPEKINSTKLADAVSTKEGKNAEFIRLSLRLFSQKDESAVAQLEEMEKAGFSDAATALFAAQLLKDPATPVSPAVMKAAASGSPAAAALIEISGGKSSPAINALAQKCYFFPKYCDRAGKIIHKPFIKCRLSEELNTIREKIDTLSASELQEMKTIWTRTAAINADSAKLPELYDILYRIEKKLGSEDADRALYRAAVAGSIDAMLDWYDMLGEKGWSAYQTRLRECAMKLHKLKVRHKIRLGLVKVVEE